MRDVFVAGAAMTRFGKIPGTSTRALAEEATLAAIADAGCAVGSVLTVDDVLASREVAHPLTLLTCSPISDGGAALVLCSADAVARLGVGSPLKILATVLVSGRDDPEGHPAVTRAAATAYERAGVAPDQLRGRCGDRQVDGARIALAENGGGFLGHDPAAAVVTILSR